MANPELVKIVRQGSEVWNSWREQQPEDTQIDLSGADLSYVYLRGINLSYADLFNANLRSIDLSYANLSYANLNHVDLSYAQFAFANLNYTDLIRSNLIRINLIHANLNFANLSHSNLNRADLRYTNLHNADLNGTILSNIDLKKTDWTNILAGQTQIVNVDLRHVIGLETVKHSNPSTIGLDTIYRSRGQIPEVFLRGCGVPEPFITNMRALVASMSPIDYYTCFISYSHQNEDFAKRLYADLQAQGVRCWFADEDLKIGDHYHQRIDEAIRLYDKLILVLSDAAVNSAWVEREVVAAREKEDRQQREVLFPLRLDDAVMETEKAWAADVRRRWHIGDFTRWKDHDSYQQAFERLLRDLKAETKGESNG